MKNHPYADMFPMMGTNELADLGKDIKRHGLQNPIVVLDGKILDGRNRYQACKMVGVEPILKQFDGQDALAFALSQNLNRRHLTVSQRAMVAAKYANLKTGANQHTKQGPPIGEPSQSMNQTRDEAAKMLGVGTSSVDRAKRVLRDAPEEIIKKVEAGEITVNAGLEQTQASTPADPPCVVIDGTKEREQTKRIKVIQSNGMAIYASAKAVMERLSRNDTQRIQALEAMIAYCQNELKDQTK